MGKAQVPSGFFGSDILAKSDFFPSTNDVGILGGRAKNRGILWVAKKVLTKGIFWGMLKNIVIFWVDKF